MTETQEKPISELKEYWKQYQKYVQAFTDWYQSRSDVTKRFLKYGGWIGLQFWLIRAPMTVLFTGMFPEIIDFQLFKFPGYLLASFTSGTILAIVGFFISEWWIWKKPIDKEKPKDAV